MDTVSVIANVQEECIYEIIAKDVEKRFDTSNYELERLLLKVKKRSYWCNERWIRQKNNERICRIKSKNM